MTAENEVFSGVCEASEAEIDMSSYQDPVKVTPDCKESKLESVNLIGNDNVNHDPDGSSVVDGDSGDSDKNSNEEVVVVESSVPEETVCGDSGDSDKNSNEEVVVVESSVPEETVCVSASTEKDDLNGTTVRGYDHEDQVESATSADPNSERPDSRSTEASKAEIDMSSYQDPVKVGPDCKGPKLESVNLGGNDNGNRDPGGSCVIESDSCDCDKNSNGEVVIVQSSVTDETVCDLVSTEKDDLNRTTVRGYEHEDQVESVLASSVDPNSKEPILDSKSKNVADTRGKEINHGEIGQTLVMEEHQPVSLSDEKDVSLCGNPNGEANDDETVEAAKKPNGTEEQDEQENGQLDCEREVEDDNGLELPPETCQADPNMGRNSNAESVAVLHSTTEAFVGESFSVDENVLHLDEATDTKERLPLGTELAKHFPLGTVLATEDAPEFLDTEVMDVVVENPHESASETNDYNKDSHIRAVRESEESFRPLISVESVQQKNLDSELKESPESLGNGQESYCEGGIEKDTADLLLEKEADKLASPLISPNIIPGTVSLNGIEFGSFRSWEDNLKLRTDHFVHNGSCPRSPDVPNKDRDNPDMPNKQDTDATLPCSHILDGHIGAKNTELQSPGNVVVSKRFQFLIKVPRFEDERLLNDLRDVQLLLDEKTQQREGIQIEVQKQKNNCRVLYNKFRDAKSEERAARELVKLKRKEIDSVQVLNNRAQSATSVREINSEIRVLEGQIQHQTLKDLNVEKALIRKIKDLKLRRNEAYSNMGRQEEARQALEQRDHIDGLLKSLKKELYDLKDKVSKAEAAATLLKEKLDDEDGKLKELQAQFKNANHIREGVYKHFFTLKTELKEKSKYFGRYKHDANAANNFAFNGDKESLHKLCINQVETMMELWNNNADFRKHYVRCNMRSTLRRLKTLDGRSLGPDEEAIVLPTVRVGKQVSNVATSPSLVSSLDQQKPVSTDGVGKSVEVEPKYQSLKSDTIVMPIVGSSSEVKVETNLEDDLQTEQELELARKAETLRRKEIDEQLKEQRRLDEKVKAQEALERKKRNAEKAQMRAEIRAQKLAEQKEKDREKRQRKKERKKSIAVDAEPGSNTNGESTPALELPAETAKECDSKESPTTTVKRSQKTSVTKQTKTKIVPPPLRNKGKRKWKQTMVWTMWISLVIVLLFIMFGGEGGVFGGGRSQRS